MSTSHNFPVVFTISISNRHEILLLNPAHTPADISAKIEAMVPSSKNCEELLAAYKKKGESEKVTQILVRWSRVDRDNSIFPKSTILTEENCEAVLEMVRLGGCRDVLEVEMEAPKGSAEKEEREDGKDVEGGE